MGSTVLPRNLLKTFLDDGRGSIVATGAEDVALNHLAEDLPFKSSGWVDLSNMAAGDVVTIRRYISLSPTGALRLDYVSPIYVGVQAAPATLDPEVPVYGVRVTVQQTAGVMRNYPFAFFLER